MMGGVPLMRIFARVSEYCEQAVHKIEQLQCCYQRDLLL